MKIIKNEKLIKRNRTIGNYMSLGALVVLGIGMYISIQRPDLFPYALVALVSGFIMTQIGIYMGNRYGRSPRPDEKLDAALKGLPNEFSIFHYTTPVAHLLVGPAGVWLLFPYHQRGQVTFKKNRWQMKGGGFLQGYMRIFGQEGIGRPDVEIDADVRLIKDYLGKQLDELQVPQIYAMLVFTSDNVEVEAADSPVPVMKAKQIKEFFRQKAKEKPLGPAQLAAIRAALPE